MEEEYASLPQPSPVNSGHIQRTEKNSVWQTSILIIANCAGAGILSLPKAVNQAGLFGGCIMIVAAALLSAYTADILGRCYSVIHSGVSGDEIRHPLSEGDDDEGDNPERICEFTPRPLAQHTTSEKMPRPTLDIPRVAHDPHDETSFFTRSPYAAIGQRSFGNAGETAVILTLDGDADAAAMIVT